MHSLSWVVLIVTSLVTTGCGGCGGDSGILTLTSAPSAPVRIGGIVFESSSGVNNLVASPLLGDFDPAGTPIPGAPVELWKDGLMVEALTTNAAGEYVFDDSNVTGGLISNAPYQVRVVHNSTFPLPGLSPIPWNQGSDDELDSDGDPTIVRGYSVADVVTPDAGLDDFSIDFGFFATAIVNN